MVLALPVLLLLLIGITANRMTASFARSEGWVSHTRDVQTQIARFRADLFRAEDATSSFALNGDLDSALPYYSSAKSIPEELHALRQLTSDNPVQQHNLDLLQPAIDRQLSLLRQLIDAKDQSMTPAEQLSLNRESVQSTSQLDSVLQSMDEEENRLLRQRTLVSADTYARVRGISILATIIVIVLLVASFLRLLVELQNRGRAEELVRRLSSRILQLQDAERRKIARELHDGIGQYFAGLKMNLDRVLRNRDLPEAEANILSQSMKMLDDGMAEARTLSYLLHPPLLDEVGFAAAAEWYVDGFAERSNITVELKMPQDLGRMPKDTELVLFRVLQEALTNVHRHSGSGRAEVCLTRHANEVVLEVEDYGKGLSQSVLEEFKRTHAGTGVGLAGMRERVSEFGGDLEIRSEGSGTLLRVRMPLPQEQEAGVSSEPPKTQNQLELRVEEAGGAGGGLFLSGQFPLSTP